MRILINELMLENGDRMQHLYFLCEVNTVFLFYDWFIYNRYS